VADRKFGPAYYRLALCDLQLEQFQNAVPQLRRALQLLKPGTPDYDDASLKLAEIMLTAAQGSPSHAEPILQEVRPMVDGFLDRNPSGWQGHKLSGDLALLAAAAAFNITDPAESRQDVAKAIKEFRIALSAKPGDYIITLALARALALGGESAEAEAGFKSLVVIDKVNLNGYYELYRLYISQKKFPEAEAALKSAIAAMPKDASLRLRLAQFYYGTQRQDELIALLNDMKKDLKMFPNAYLDCGDFFLRAGQFDTAQKQYEAGIRYDKDRTNLYLKREIEVYIRQGNLAMAQTKNQQILQSDPKDPEARGLRATFMLEKNQINEAEVELQSVVTARPSNFIARFNLGRAYFAKNQYDQARQEFDKCIDLNPAYLPARYARTQVAIVLGNFDAAVHDADEILKIDPNSVQGRVMKAAALQRLNKFDDARKLLNEVLDKNPKQEETLLELGVLDLNQKRAKDALEHFHRAYDAAPQNIRGLLGQSRALLMDGQPDRSVDLIRQAAQKNPSFQLQRELGNAQMAAREFDAAIATYQTLVGSVTDMKVKGDLWSRIAEGYKYKGDFQKCIQYMELAAKALPDNASIATSLAQLYDSPAVSDLPKARIYYEKALKIDQNNPVALNNLAYLIAQTNGDLNQALTYATEAKQRLPSFLEVSDTIGLIYLKKNSAASAIDEFQRLVAEAPLDPTYHYHYAMALNQKGDTADAKAQCEVALSNRPQKPLEAQIRTLEASLK
jgi:tetratricopeptide (TPR) repeat protein